MTNDVINKVLYDVDQRADTTSSEKETARLNIGVNLNNLATVGDVQAEATERATAVQDLDDTKQDNLVAGANIQLNGTTISATDTTYTAGTNVQISNSNVISATDTTYTAGSNVQISNSNVISATDTTYSAGTNVQISDSNVISATDTTYSAGPNITISDSNVISCEKAVLTAGANVSISSSSDPSTRTITYNISSNDTTYSAGDNITITNGVISAKSVVTSQHVGIGSPADTPYDLFTYDGINFKFRASANACALLVQSDEVSTISGIVENRSTANSMAPDGYTIFKNQSIATAYSVYAMSQYEIVSTANEVLDLTLWYTKDNTPKSIIMHVLKTGQVDLNISLVGG